MGLKRTPIYPHQETKGYVLNGNEYSSKYHLLIAIIDTVYRKVRSIAVKIKQSVRSFNRCLRVAVKFFSNLTVI
jgi:hypothetical protein